jgi:general secretion pathway protein G
LEPRINTVLRQRRAGQRGFTLIELLVVIAVLAVLAAVVIFNVTGVKNSGSAAACATDVKSVQSAYDAYLNDGNAAVAAAVYNYKTTPAGALWTALVPSYLHTGPTSCASGFTLGASNTITGS